jgi:hypothetical protein
MLALGANWNPWVTDMWGNHHNGLAMRATNDEGGLILPRHATYIDVLPMPLKGNIESNHAASTNHHGHDQATPQGPQVRSLLRNLTIPRAIWPLEGLGAKYAYIKQKHSEERHKHGKGSMIIDNWDHPMAPVCHRQSWRVVQSDTMHIGVPPSRSKATHFKNQRGRLEYRFSR